MDELEIKENIEKLIQKCKTLQRNINNEIVLTMSYYDKPPKIFIDKYVEGKKFILDFNYFKMAYSELKYASMPELINIENKQIDSKFLEDIEINLYNIKKFIEQIGKKNKIAETVKTAETAETAKDNQVFIVHGHDEELKEKVARFIEKIKLKPIILHEQSSSGNTIIEKIERYTNTGFAIVLYTPCDTGKSIKEHTEKGRARQNVVFEHGYLIAKLGRKNVCALVKGEIEKPTDISGVIYIDTDKSNWENELFKELKAANYNIDANDFV